MKLLHLTNFYPPYGLGAAERQCSLLVRELAARSHVSRVLTSDVTTPNVPDHEPHVNRKLRLIPRQGARSFLRLLLFQRANRQVLIDELDQLMPDVVVVWGMAGLPFSLLWELVRRHHPMVFAILDPWPRTRVRDDLWYRWWAAPLPLDQKLLRRVLREIRLDRAILRSHPAPRPSKLPLRHGFFASRALRDSVRLAGFETEGMEILPHCLARDEIPAAHQPRDEPRRLLWIGPLDSDHDPLTAVQALQELRHQGDMRFSLDLFGRGDLAAATRVRDHVRNAQLGGAVTLRSAPVDELAMLYPSFDILLHTARQPDPFPHVLLRAMAARLPVIAAPEGSVADVVRSGENALTFHTGDPTDLAAKIQLLSGDRALVERLTTRGFREVLDTYSVASVAGRLDLLLHAAHRDPGLQPA